MAATTIMRTYQQRRLFLLTLDPLHIGAGGRQLGRVDMSIAREPGTNLPKIPGTSLSGAARSYAAYQLGKPGCAGQRNHCGQADCPVCYTFGSLRASGDNGEHHAAAGTVNIFDAQLLLFPVRSMAGPVWVSTAERLREAGFQVEAEPVCEEQAATTLPNWDKPLTLGWLLVPARPGLQVRPPEGSAFAADDWQAVGPRLVLVSERLFGQVVNSNLEVRTSVSIDPFTGAAAEGALFTYEAIPRAAWLWCDVVEDDYRGHFPVPVSQGAGLGSRPMDVVRQGLVLAALLGIGGMGTRGFGRIRLSGEQQAT